jgi:hypothetical protein
MNDAATAFHRRASRVLGGGTAREERWREERWQETSVGSEGVGLFGHPNNFDLG